MLMLMLMSCYVAVYTSENRDDISTSTSLRQSTVSSAILLNIDGGWYREFRQEMVFCTCVCRYRYVASVLNCLSLCLFLCPSENQPLPLRWQLNINVRHFIMILEMTNLFMLVLVLSANILSQFCQFLHESIPLKCSTEMFLFSSQGRSQYEANRGTCLSHCWQIHKQLNK